MAYRVKIMPRAQRDLKDLYRRIGPSDAARAWYRGLKTSIRGLRLNPSRCPATPEDKRVRHLLYGGKPHVYRVLFRIAESQKQVDILHIRHGARQEFTAGDLK